MSYISTVGIECGCLDRQDPHRVRRCIQLQFAALFRRKTQGTRLTMSEKPEAAEAAPTPAETVIIGAGPVGLFQIFELGLLGISSHIIDSLAQPGGQCTKLYQDKPHYEIPALPI